MTYFSINPKDLFVTQSEKEFNFSCVLSTDLTLNNWVFRWTNGQDNFTSGMRKDGQLFKVQKICSPTNLTCVAGSSLNIKIENRTILTMRPVIKQFYCSAFNTYNKMELNSRKGHLYSLGKLDSVHKMYH